MNLILIRFLWLRTLLTSQSCVLVVTRYFARCYKSSFDTIFQIKSHKLILASQSKFFEGFFRRESKEMVMLDFKEEYVRICIAYMATGEVNLDVEAEELEGVLEVGFDASSGNLMSVFSCNHFLGGELLGHELLG